MKTQPQEPDGVDEHARELITLVRPGLPWQILRDDGGFARAITRDGWAILHLEVGTVRNEHCIEEFVAMLNRVNKAQKHFAALISAAQAVCQSRGGSNPEATRIVHEKAVNELEQALAILNGTALELQSAITGAKAALVGGSNDSEHDALQQLMEALGYVTPDCNCRRHDGEFGRHVVTCPCAAWEKKEGLRPTLLSDALGLTKDGGKEYRK